MKKKESSERRLFCAAETRDEERNMQMAKTCLRILILGVTYVLINITFLDAVLIKRKRTKREIPVPYSCRQRQ